MSPLRQALADYLAMRRSLGYQLDRQEKLLGQFLHYLEARGVERITVEHALAWATLPAGAQRWHAKRLRAVRVFAGYLKSMDVPVEVPASDLLPDKRGRAVPFLYTDEQIAALIDAAGTLSTPHRAATYRTLISLLAVTGMRRGEAVSLDRHDFNPRSGVVVIRAGKFGKSRELPLHPSSVRGLSAYLRRPDRPCSATPSEPALLVSTVGRRLPMSGVERTFRTLVRNAGLLPRSPECRPRIHDLRHSFAVRTLLDAYRSGEDVEPRLVSLSTYLGHGDPSHTYWYLEAAPELMALASDRLERHLGGEL
jgi:integrase